MKKTWPFDPCDACPVPLSLKIPFVLPARYFKFCLVGITMDTNQRGQVLPLVAVCMVLLCAVAGLAVDVGYHRYEQRVQQTATDSAALAGAADYNYGSTVRTASARKDAATNGYTDSVGGVTVTVNSSYTSAFTGTSSAVEVVITKAYPKFFEGIFGGGSTVTVSTRAVARLAAIDNRCVILLNPADSTNYNSATISANGCAIADNGSGSNMNNATIDASSISYAGAAPNENGATFPHATPAPGIAVSDPCPHISGCAYLANNPPSSTPCVTPVNAPGFINPGCYPSGAMSLSGNVTVNPGVYIINGAADFGKAVMTGNGVTFYITGTGQLNANKATFNLTPPATGQNTAGVLFYQVPSNTNDPNFNKTSGSTSGLFYFPTVHVNYNKTAGGYTVLVFGAANFNGNSLSFPPPPSNLSLIQQAVLAE